MRGASQLLLAVALIVSILVFVGGRPAGLTAAMELTSLGHPDVAWIDATALARALRSGAPPLLVDVRSEAEYAVSHLPGARRLEPGAPLPADLLSLPRSTPVVVYSAVAYRSALAGEALQRAGFTSVRNLDGGIFRWANRNMPLESAGGPASLVHSYGLPWKVLLRADRRAR
jgi:rhodanese-related sulfurtransferase